MPLVTVLFWVFAAITVGSALLCVTRRSAVASAIWLVVAMFNLAALFVLLDAQFLAVLQVLVYAGAVMVLFLFVIMLLNLGRGGPSDRKGLVGLGMGVVLALLMLAELKAVVHAAPAAAITLPAGTMAANQQAQGLVEAVAYPLYGAYLVPFEITSVLLLAAVVGAVVLAKRRL